MGYSKPEKILEITVENGVKKTKYSLMQTMILGFEAGAFIALGYLVFIRVTATLSPNLEGLSSLIGASVFPIGLILTLIAGGELLTGNMMAVPLARMANRITTGQVFFNWFLVTVSNFLGAIFVAYFFGHLVGLTEVGPYLLKTISIADHKLEASFLQAFISGIGCNWLVAAAVWLCYGAEDMFGKIAGIWFPTMTFVAIGFQHVVANMFVIPAAIFAGHFTWIEYLHNFIPVFLGNAIGGTIFIAMAYWYAFGEKKSPYTKTSMEKTMEKAG
ncbi:formate/nitrite transporter family protein [Neobacillus sp. MM2021_6]|uniref:formate/nitrite transporter family protein n=1 Tax=Bacillaceae TaxID=186817 RepID=UPI001408C85A|nr:MULTISPECIES: formate/nitrite transporter family protein [Bacillaceae]MBO0960548.1 formate/nitrite transporter family protein [Neobacillus sp. MM2021_6]NHC19254.1 formate/nitrite transporter family protein [Bacillus sp. MM2020_4]